MQNLNSKILFKTQGLETQLRVQKDTNLSNVTSLQEQSSKLDKSTARLSELEVYLQKLEIENKSLNAKSSDMRAKLL